MQDCCIINNYILLSIPTTEVEDLGQGQVGSLINSNYASHMMTDETAYSSEIIFSVP